MQSRKSADAGSAARGKGPESGSELDERYAEIGISAVAAAVRYQGETPRHPAPVSVSSDRHE